uniref:Uncharacterized protein n=1 Tax=Arundo donax TaxID=35708 RepID=A0A0A9FHU7_ARUDO
MLLDSSWHALQATSEHVPRLLAPMYDASSFPFVH